MQQKVLGVTHPMALPFVESLAFLCTRSDFTEKALFVSLNQIELYIERKEIIFYALAINGHWH
jgi:hypothetical protein